MRVAIVEDSDGMRLLYSTWLRRLGHEPLDWSALTLPSAPIPDEAADAAIVDLHLGPTRDGLDVLRELRAARPAMRLLAVSGAIGNGLEREARQAGADVCLPKGLDLYEAIAEALGQ